MVLYRLWRPSRLVHCGVPEPVRPASGTRHGEYVPLPLTSEHRSVCLQSSRAQNHCLSRLVKQSDDLGLFPPLPLAPKRKYRSPGALPTEQHDCYCLYSLSLWLWDFGCRLPAALMLRFQPRSKFLPDRDAEFVDLGQMPKQSGMIFICPGLTDARCGVVEKRTSGFAGKITM